MAKVSTVSLASLMGLIYVGLLNASEAGIDEIDTGEYLPYAVSDIAAEIYPYMTDHYKNRVEDVRNTLELRDGEQYNVDPQVVSDLLSMLDRCTHYAQSDGKKIALKRMEIITLSRLAQRIRSYVPQAAEEEEKQVYSVVVGQITSEMDE